MTLRDDGQVRLDTWLWAARFFKTRALAAEAIDGGKVEVNDARAKASKVLHEGDRVRVRKGPFEFHVTVRALALRRGSATVAAEMYEEDPASRAARERHAEQLRDAPPAFAFDRGRPTKKDRREIRRFRGRDD